MGQDAFIRCLAACNYEHDCSSQCNRAYSSCTYNCPCNLGCPSGCGDGCPHQLCQCRQPELDEHYIECKEHAQVHFDMCIDECDHDILCDVVCELDYADELKDCPCQVNCPNGCPCPNYQCSTATTTNSRTSTSGMLYSTTSTTVRTTTTASNRTTTESTGTTTSTTVRTTTTAVLHLSSFESNTSYVRNSVNELLTSQIEYADGTEVFGSCSCLVAGQMMVFGGAQQPRQVSRLADCRLEVRDQLRIYDFSYGACHVMTAIENDKWVLLCFSFGYERDCIKYNVLTKENKGQPSSYNDHARTRMAMYG